MRVLKLTSMAFKYFNLHKKRYIFLMVALSFGFGVITTLTSIKEGMEQNLYNTAQSHYAGDIVILGEDRRSKSEYRISEPQKIISKIDELDLPISNIVKRTQISNGTLYFNGSAVKQKYIVGLDWENESGYLSSLDYSVQSRNPYVAQSILISTPVSEELNAQIGDQVILEIRTKSGQLNTGFFIVSGIVDDSSIFAYYKVYLSRTKLNQMIQFTSDECSTLGLLLDAGESVEDISQLIHSSMSEEMELFPLLTNRDELAYERSKSWNGVKYNILTLPVYLSEVAELLLAIQFVSYFLYILMLFIIVVSVLVTYRLILHEREKEIGTMRAIAFTQRDIVSLLLLESFVLLFLSLCFGYLFSRVTTFILSSLLMDWIPSFEIFMKNGKLTAIYSLRTTFNNIVIVLISLLPAVLWPVYIASKQPLAVVLSGGNK